MKYVCLGYFDEARWVSLQESERMKELGANMPFDGKRMIWGGFNVLVEA